MQVLSSLAIDAWYKLVIWLGVAVLLLGLSVRLQVPNRAAIALGLGAVIFGIGQWINHPLQTRVDPHGIATSYNRQPRLGGVLTEVAGAAIAALGVWLLLAA